MFITPIIDRDLRIALRKHHAVKSRFRIALLSVIVVGVIVLFSWLLGIGPQSWGPFLYQILFFGGLYMAIVPAAQVSVELFCEERRNQTLELLYLAGLGSGELFFGKLFGGTLVASSDLLAFCPVLAVPFLSGGLSVNLFLATIFCFPLLLLLTVAIGVLSSVLCEDDGAALVCAIVLGVVMCGTVPLLYYLGNSLTGSAPFANGWLCLSPAYAPYLVEKNFVGGSPYLFWKTAGLIVVWSVCCLGLAAALLRWNWRREIARLELTGWQRKWKTWLHGSPAWRQTLRYRALTENAFQWLAEQDRRPVLLAWGLMVGTAVLWLLGWAAWPHVWASPMNFYLTALLLIFGTSLIMTYAAARRIGIERREGSLELLLTTPLQPEEIVTGQLGAAKAQFLPVRTALLALCVLMMLAGLLTRSWTTPAVISYVLIWCFFFVWCLCPQIKKVPLAMWISLNTGRPTHALFLFQRKGSKRGSMSGWFWWFYMFMNFRNFWMGLKFASHFPSGSTVELVIVSFVSVIALIVLAASERDAPPMVDRLVCEMRLIAQEPVPDMKDPRFKNWNVSERMPMSAYVKTYPERKKRGLLERTGSNLGRQAGLGWNRIRRW